ncbi:MAG: hypothetical protein SGPRY_012553, partial [Prymnesium sp.]
MSELGESMWGELCGIARSLKEKLTVSKLAEHDWSDSLEPLVCEEVGRGGGEEDEDEEAWEEEEDVSERTTSLQTVTAAQWRGELVEKVTSRDVELLLEAGYVLDGPDFQQGVQPRAGRRARTGGKQPPADAPPTSPPDGEGAVSDADDSCFVCTCTLSRDELHAACKGELERMKAPLIRAAAACSVQLHTADRPQTTSKSARRNSRNGRTARPSTRGRRIDRVLLVGAASRTPAVVTMLRELTGVAPDMASVPPELA